MIIAIANQKGGAGKSTTAAAMAVALGAKRRRVLLVDMDAQGNTTDTAGADTTGTTMYDVLTNRTDAAAAIQTTALGDIIPASLDLAGADAELAAVTGREQRLKKALSPIKDRYDIIIVDTPPALGVLTINALTAADGVIIPTGADKYGFQGIMQIHGQINEVREYTNPNLMIYGILLTRHTQRRVLLRHYAEDFDKLAADMGTRLYKTYIRDCTAIREAQAQRQSIFEYAPKSSGAEDYSAFVAEFLKNTKGTRNA